MSPPRIKIELASNFDIIIGRTELANSSMDRASDYQIKDPGLIPRLIKLCLSHYWERKDR